MTSHIGEAAVQLLLELTPGPPAATPPPCRCCQGRGSVLAGFGGWLDCTWCEGSGADPLPLDRPTLRVLRQEGDRDVPRSA